MNFYDQNGDVLYYWPVSGLRANTESDVLVVGIDTPADAAFTLAVDAQCAVLARLHGTTDPFLDLALNPFDLSVLPVGRTLFDLKLRASSGITGSPRVALTPGAAVESPADWRG